MTREEGSKPSIRESKTSDNTSAILCRDTALRVKLTVDRPHMPTDISTSLFVIESTYLVNQR
jgi:hypothetical protein